MGRYWEAFKSSVAVFKEEMGPGEYLVAGRPVRCPHCRHDKFVSGHALLNSRGRTAFNVDWMDPSATTLICAECGRIEWFAQEAERINE